MNGRVYIHDTLPIEGGARGKMIELIRSRWGPHLEHTHGVRLVGVWATVGSTAEWPETRALWEMEDWDAFARAQAGQHPMEEKDVFLADIWSQALEYRRGGTSMLLRPAAFSPDVATIRERGLSGDIVLHEDVRSRPGCLADYHAALAAEYLPLAEARGLRLLGCYSHAILPNRGVNLWVVRDWNHWQATMESDQSNVDDAELRAWSERQAGWLADLDTFLVAKPPTGALRT